MILIENPKENNENMNAQSKSTPKEAAKTIESPSAATKDPSTIKQTFKGLTSHSVHSTRFG